MSAAMKIRRLRAQRRHVEDLNKNKPLNTAGHGKRLSYDLNTDTWVLKTKTKTKKVKCGFSSHLWHLTCDFMFCILYLNISKSFTMRDLR